MSGGLAEDTNNHCGDGVRSGREANREDYQDMGEGHIGEFVLEGPRAVDAGEFRTDDPGSAKAAAGPGKLRVGDVDLGGSGVNAMKDKEVKVGAGSAIEEQLVRMKEATKML